MFLSQSNVVGQRCDQCRQGSYNLQESSPEGCTECFCSGVTKSCASKRLYREQIPMNLFEDKFTLTDHLGYIKVADEPIPDISRNEFSANVYDTQTYYWSLPARFLGNQILSYGGQLNFTVRNEGHGSYVEDQDVLLTGNGLTLSWSRRSHDEGVSLI